MKHCVVLQDRAKAPFVLGAHHELQAPAGACPHVYLYYLHLGRTLTWVE